MNHGRVLAKVPRNLTGRNPSFAGRQATLARIRAAFTAPDMPRACAVHGVGGMGKTAVSREYAHLFGPEYLGGPFELDLSTTATGDGLLGPLVQAARNYLKADIPTGLPEPQQFDRARAAFDTLPPAEVALLTLDNLNEDAIRPSSA